MPRGLCFHIRLSYQAAFCRFFQKLGDVLSALQFLVLSKCQEEAFKMAEVNSNMGVVAHCSV